MAYIGRNPAIGTQKVLDSLESQFNGTLTTFDLRYNSNTIYPPIASALIVSLGGVLQEPGVAYTVASDTITFASAPPTGSDCWILLYTEFGGAAGATANLTVSNNLTIGNELHGPANFVIDPAAIGDNTGTVEIKGNLTVQGTQTTVNSTTVDLDHLSLGDNEIANFGDGNDLQIYHNGTTAQSIIEESGAGSLIIQGTNLLLRSTAGENYFQGTADGSVELFYDAAKKFETTSTGISVTGLTNTDTLNVSGFSTFSDDVRITDDDKLRFGTSGSGILQIYTNGTNSFFKQASGDLKYELADQFIIQKDDGDEPIAIFTADGSVELYYDNSKKIETSSTGVTVTGALEVSAATNITVGGTALPSLTGLLGGSLDGTLGTVTMAYLPSAPSSPVQGQFYFNSLNQKAQIYTGSSFVDLVPSGGGGGGGAGTTDAQATFRKYTYSITSTTNAVSGSSDTVVTAGDFVVGNVYTIKTIGTTDFTAIGASANTIGVEFTATGAGTGTGDAYDTLYYATGGIQNIEVYVNGVKSVEGSTNDYVATTGTSVNFTANLASGDVVDVQVYELLTNDAYVLASGGTFTGNVGINTSTINNRLHIHSDANEQGILLTQGGSNFSSIVADADRSSADLFILEILAKWNGTKAAQITLESGDDTTNKDDGRIKFSTSAAGGSLGIAMRIEPDGKVGIGGDHNPLSPLHIEANNATLLRLERAGIANAGIRFGNDTSVMHAGLSTNATFFGIGTSENIGSSATQLCVTRADGNVGIGNTAPVNRLQVSGGDATFDNNTYIGFNIYNNGGWYQVGTGNGAVLKHHSTNGFQIYTGPDSGNGAGGAASVSARLTVSDAGNVGIGANTPLGNLHISSGNSGDCKLILEADTDNNAEGDNSFIIFKLDGGVENSAVWAGNADGSNDNSLNLSNAVSSAGGIRFFTSSTDGGWESASERMRISPAGDVGVGTNAPDEKLHVNGNIHFTNFALISSYDASGIGGSNIDHIWHEDTSEFGTGGSWNFASDGSYKSLASLSNIKVGHVYVDNGNLGTSAGDIQDLARFYANNGNGTSIRLQAKRKVAGTTWTSASMKIFCHTDSTQQGYLEFNPQTTSAGDANNDVAIGSNSGELVRFKNNGNVGIGTTSPAYKLEVEGDIKVGELGTLWFSDTSGSIEKIASGSNAGTLDLYADADIHFFESDSSVRKFTVDVNNAQLDLGDNLDTTTPQVHFDYHENCWFVGPNVGIGTTNPTTKLEVKGGNIFIRDDNYLVTNRIRCGDGGQELILTAGESHNYIGQSPSSQYPPTIGGEKVYLVAEGGMEVYSSTGNWVNSGATRKTGTFCDSSGNASIPGTLSEGSDARLKTNIRTIPDALEKVKSLRGAVFNRVDKDNKEEIGLIAQEVEEVLPQVVEESKYTWEDENMKSIGYGKIVGLLIEAVKEQQVMIDELRQEITELKNS